MRFRKQRQAQWEVRERIQGRMKGKDESEVESDLGAATHKRGKSLLGENMVGGERGWDGSEAR